MPYLVMRKQTIEGRMELTDEQRILYLSVAGNWTTDKNRAWIFNTKADAREQAADWNKEEIIKL